MAKVYIGYDQYGLEGVDDEFIQFVFQVVVGLVKLASDSEVGLVVTSDDHMRQLNRQYRDKDRPTNVLSFTYIETNNQEFISRGDENYIGDIYISYDQIIKQAKEDAVTAKEEFTRLFVHGLLHLAGIHHDGEKATERMEALEDEVIRHILAAG